MALFVEVDSVEKKAKVIINLDSVVEVAPLAAGGCLLYFPDSASVGGVRAMKVKEEYSMFKQFAMQTVTSEDIANRIEAINKAAGIEKPAKPKPSVKIPKFDGSLPDDN